jgi:hypothetical protein
LSRVAVFVLVSEKLVRTIGHECPTAAASPSNIRVSFPVPVKFGGWTTCIKASAHGITGRSLGTQTYLVNIEHDQISLREHVDDTHWCAKETYQSL